VSSVVIYAPGRMRSIYQYLSSYSRHYKCLYTMLHAAACSCSWERLRQAGSPYGSNRFRRPCHSSHKRYRFRARHDISGSSFRVNLGTGFTPLLYDEAGKIKVFFKVLEGCFEMFYKEDEEAMYPPSDKEGRLR